MNEQLYSEDLENIYNEAAGMITELPFIKVAEEIVKKVKQQLENDGKTAENSNGVKYLVVIQSNYVHGLNNLSKVKKRVEREFQPEGWKDCILKLVGNDKVSVVLRKGQY